MDQKHINPVLAWLLIGVAILVVVSLLAYGIGVLPITWYILISSIWH